MNRLRHLPWLAAFLPLGLAVASDPTSIRLGIVSRSPPTISVAGPAQEMAVVEVSSNLLDWVVLRAQVLLRGPEDPEWIYPPADHTVFLRVHRYETPLTNSYVEPPATFADCLWGPPDYPTNRDAAIPTATTPIKTIRLFFHLLANDDGSEPAATPEVMNSQVETLNQVFRPWRIQFVAASQQLRSSGFRHLASPEQAQDLKRLFDVSPATQHNIFVTDTPPDELGRSSFPWDADALSAGGTVTSDSRFGANELVLVHELGHALGLWHTHHAYEQWQRGYLCPPCSESKPDLGGDRCADTASTPFQAPNKPIGTLDPCTGQPWPVPSPGNYMTDFPYWDGRFTPQQAGRMHAWIGYRLSGWLDTNTPAAPSGLAVMASPFGEVTISWINNAWNDTGLVVERAANQGSFQVVAQLPARTSAFVDATDPPSAQVSYRIRATNAVASSYASTVAATGTGPAPLTLWADAAYPGGTVDGTERHPFPTFAEAYDAAQIPTIVNLRPGHYQFGLPMDKPLRLVPQGGTVLLEKP